MNFSGFLLIFGVNSMKKNIMIKTAIAGAIVAATTATTIADTNLYGRMRAGLVCTDDGSNTDCSLENRSSRFGIKVDQAVSDGLTAFGKYEFSVDLDEGSLNAGGNANRLAYVGLKGGFGEVSIGTRWSPMYSYVMSPVDPFQLLGGTSGISTYDGGFRNSDTLNYKNKFGTTGMHLQLVTDEDAPDGDFVDEVQIGAGFKAGPVNLGAAYSSVTDGDSQFGVSATTKLSMAKVGVSVLLTDADAGNDSTTVNGLVGLGLGGGRTVNLGLGYADVDKVDSNPLIVSAEYEHKLSKNFRWFAAVQNADADVKGVDDVLKYGAGMRLEF